MSKVSQLKVFKECYDLLTLIFNATPNVKRDYRHTVLEVIKKDVVELCIVIYRANKAQEPNHRLLSIADGQELLLRIIIQCRILADMYQISTQLIALISLHTTSIDKQLEGWAKYTSAKIDTNKSENNTRNGDVKTTTTS